MHIVRRMFQNSVNLEEHLLLRWSSDTYMCKVVVAIKEAESVISILP